MGAPLKAKSHTYRALISALISDEGDTDISAELHFPNVYIDTYCCSSQVCGVPPCMSSCQPFNYSIPNSWMTQWWSDGGVEIVVTAGLFRSVRWLRYELQPLCGSACSQCPSQTFQAQPALHEQPSWLLWLVSSALCMLSIFQSGRKRWSDWCSRCQFSSGLSEVLCQILLPAGPAGSKEINQEERPGRVWHRQEPLFFLLFFAATVLLFLKRHPPWYLPVVISFGRVWGAAEECKNEIDFTVWLCSSWPVGLFPS